MDSRTSYDFVALAKDVLERLAVDMRENLYYSLDAYSTASDFLASTLYRGQSMGWISDKSLLSAFEENMAYSSSGWSLGQSLLAVPRMARYVGEERWVITVYLFFGGYRWGGASLRLGERGRGQAHLLYCGQRGPEPGDVPDCRWERTAKRPCLHGQLANAARVKYPAALQRCKLDTPLLAAGYLIQKYFTTRMTLGAVKG